MEVKNNNIDRALSKFKRKVEEDGKLQLMGSKILMTCQRMQKNIYLQLKTLLAQKYQVYQLVLNGMTQS